MKLILTTLSFVSIAVAASAAVFVTNSFDKDAFVRSLAPTFNYGGGGALSVSGAHPTMGSPTNGAFDSFISFNTAAMVSTFNSTFGTSNWVITSAALNITRNQSPGSALFNSGNGSFQIRWIANDTWTNGTGMPMAPATNGVCYNQEPTYLNTNTDTNIGSFNFTGNVTMNIPLALPSSFVTNMQAGGEVGLFVTAIDTNMGLVFYSSRFSGNPAVLPNIVVSAMAQPVISAVNVSGTNVVLSATNGVVGGKYYVLASTNVAAPLNQWSPVATNVLAGSGNFIMTVTNGASTNTPQFFILQTH